MVKIPYNIRLTPNLKNALDLFAVDKNLTTTEIVETAIYEFLKKNKDTVTSKELLRLLENLEMQKTRENTKQEMRRLMFLYNAKNRCNKMFKDGFFSKEQLERLLSVWVIEAEANGINKEVFIREIRKTIGGFKND